MVLDSIAVFDCCLPSVVYGNAVICKKKKKEKNNSIDFANLKSRLHYNKLAQRLLSAWRYFDIRLHMLPGIEIC